MIVQGKAPLNLGELTEFFSSQKLLRPDLQICMYLRIPKLSEPHVCSGNKVCFLNCSVSWI